MSNDNLFIMNLLNWCQEKGIQLIFDRTLSRIDIFSTNDCTLIVTPDNEKHISEWIRVNAPNNQFNKNPDRSSYLIDRQSKPPLQLTLISSFEIVGIPYLDIHAVINRSVIIDDLYYLDELDQLIFIIIENCIKQKSSLPSYEQSDLIQKALTNYPDTLTYKVIELFGESTGLNIIDQLKQYKLDYHPDYLVIYLLNALKNNPVLFFCNTMRWAWLSGYLMLISHIIPLIRAKLGK